MTGRKQHRNKVSQICALSALAILPSAGCVRKVPVLEGHDAGAEDGLTSCSRQGLCQALPAPMDKLDLLFVVDNSSGMDRSQSALTFTPFPDNQCRNGRAQRIQFTAGAKPPSDVRVALDCAPEASKRGD